MTIKVNEFFDNNPLFKLIKQTDGKSNSSYKSRNNEYIVECWKCDEQAEKRGTAIEKCMRCRRTLIVDEDNNNDPYTIVQPTGEEKKIADEKMKKPARVLVEPVVAPVAAPVVVPTVAPIAAPVMVAPKTRFDRVLHNTETQMVAPKNDLMNFLKSTTTTTSGIDKIKDDKKEDDKKEDDKIEDDKIEEEVPIKESILPKKKQSNKKAPIPVEKPVINEQGNCPTEYKKEMRIIELKPGQSFYIEELGILIVGKE